MNSTARLSFNSKIHAKISLIAVFTHIELQAQQPKTSQIRSNVEHMMPTYNIQILLSHSNSMTNRRREFLKIEFNDISEVVFWTILNASGARGNVVTFPDSVAIRSFADLRRSVSKLRSGIANATVYCVYDDCT